MSQVKAISYSQKDCGKHVSDTKKRFTWIFQIDDKNYTLELVNSALSGKKTVLLNMEQIYHQKNILNIDFDFTHMISGHSFKIFREQDKINNFQLRIDNRTFNQVKLGKNKTQKTGLTRQYSKKQSDPFAQFKNFASNDTKTQNKKNEFGDFDFDSFSKPTPTNQYTKIQQKTVKNTNDSLLDFGQNSKVNQTPPLKNFQTNQFTTNTNNGFDNFSNNFKQTEKNLLDMDQNQFSTNTYLNRNHYLDLKTTQQTSDKYYGEGFQAPVNDKSFWNNFGQYNQQAGLAKKKAINNAAMNLNQAKKVTKEFIGSLI